MLLFRLQISLQHALYLLHHGMLDDASRNLGQAETWRYGEKSSSQEALINLVQAYKGLLQYYTWSKKKKELSELGECIQGDCFFGGAIRPDQRDTGILGVNLIPDLPAELYPDVAESRCFYGWKILHLIYRWIKNLFRQNLDDS